MIHIPFQPRWARVAQRPSDVSPYMVFVPPGWRVVPSSPDEHVRPGDLYYCPGTSPPGDWRAPTARRHLYLLLIRRVFSHAPHPRPAPAGS